MSQPAPEQEPVRILFAEWAGPQPAPLGVRPVQPCPVCGHPTMDCTTHIKWIPQEEPNG